MSCCAMAEEGAWEEEEMGWLVRTAWQPAAGTPGGEGSLRPQDPGLDRASRSEINRPAGASHWDGGGGG